MYRAGIRFGGGGIMMREMMKWLIAYGLCPIVGGFVIWWKQGKYLTELQPVCFLIFGPITPLIALLPRSFFTSHEKANPPTERPNA